MGRSVVLLRGVNVGAHNRIRMPAFAEVLEGVGCSDVVTHLQSGNAVVTTRSAPAALERAVRAALEEHAGLDVAVMVRTGADLSCVVAQSPWTGLDPKRFHVGFLSGQLDPAVVAAIDHEALAPERIAVGPGVVYLDYANGVQRNKLDRVRLGVEVTARNWRTVTALEELAR